MINDIVQHADFSRKAAPSKLIVNTFDLEDIDRSYLMNDSITMHGVEIVASDTIPEGIIILSYPDNSYEIAITNPIGDEVLYITSKEFADTASACIEHELSVFPEAPVNIPYSNSGNKDPGNWFSYTTYSSNNTNKEE